MIYLTFAIAFVVSVIGAAFFTSGVGVVVVAIRVSLSLLARPIIADQSQAPDVM